jgi:fibronectin type 3 domain-containing protein
LKSGNAWKIALGLLVLALAWLGFQLGTHRHTGILRAMAGVRQILSHTPESSAAQMKASAPSGPQHSVLLSWRASTSAVAGYNVYRRDTAGLTKINTQPVPDTNYVDSSVKPGTVYFYVAKAVDSSGKESAPSNEVRAVIPSP